MEKDTFDYTRFDGVIPISSQFGFDRGTPIDRYYIEKFLKDNEVSIQGAVLEIKDGNYTAQFGGRRVTHPEVLDIDTGNVHATIHADLRCAEKLPEGKYDCIICTQVLQFVDVYEKAIKNLHRMLKKGGVLICTVPSISRVAGVSQDYWRFTQASAQFIFKKVFGEKLQVRTYGNVFAAICFLEGLAVQEVPIEKLQFDNKNFPLVVCVRAEK